MQSKKIVLAITGASGSIYAKVLLDKLTTYKEQFEEVAIVLSTNAVTVWEHELGNSKWKEYPFTYYDKMDYFAPIASGSSKYDTMVICPCSMGTAGRIAQGISNDLITRAADVILKERRKLILVTRDTPLSLIHLNNFTTLTQAGAIICPASPSFYSLPKSFEQLALTVIERVLDMLEVKQDAYRWASEKK